VNTAIAIGSYFLGDFVGLNFHQCRSIFPDSPILVSDDRSTSTDSIEALVDYSAAFVTSNHRRGACAGKIQAIVSGLSFAQQEGADILLFLNQRFVPVLPEFREFVEGPFNDSKINIVVPGRAVAGKIALPSSKYFNGLGILTDVLAIRIGAISPEQLLAAYVDGYKFGKFASQLMPEMFIGKLLGTHFKDSAYISSALGDGKVEKRAFLRREQAAPEDYKALAEKHGFEGQFDTRDWMEMEKNYMCRPSLIQ
jgi:hypothetical protein